jgi:hypothetical protein
MPNFEWCSDAYGIRCRRGPLCCLFFGASREFDKVVIHGKLARA